MADPGRAARGRTREKNQPTKREIERRFFVLLSEEFGFAFWFWFPRMTHEALQAWWQAVDAVPGRTPLFFDRRNLPGRFVRDDGTLWGALYTTGWYWYAHAHWEDDSILVRPDGRVILHRGHPSPQDYPTRIRFPGEPEPEPEPEPDPEEPDPEEPEPEPEPEEPQVC